LASNSRSASPSCRAAFAVPAGRTSPAAVAAARWCAAMGLLSLRRAYAQSFEGIEQASCFLLIAYTLCRRAERAPAAVAAHRRAVATTRTSLVQKRPHSNISTRSRTSWCRIGRHDRDRAQNKRSPGRCPPQQSRGRTGHTRPRKLAERRPALVVTAARAPINYAKGAHRRLPSAKPFRPNSSLCTIGSRRLIGLSAMRWPLPYMLVDDDSAMESICRYEPMVDDNPTTAPPPPKEDLVNIVVVSMANGLCDTE
jgi:hypothetical protein